MKKKKNRRKKKGEEEEREIAILDENVEYLSDIVSETWKIPAFPITKLGLGGYGDKEINEIMRKTREIILKRYSVGILQYFFTANGEKKKKKKEFLPSRDSAVLRITPGFTRFPAKKRKEVIKQILEGCPYSKAFLATDTTISPKQLIKKYKSGHISKKKHKLIKEI